MCNYASFVALHIKKNKEEKSMDLIHSGRSVQIFHITLSHSAWVKLSRKSNFCDSDSYILICYAVGNKYFVTAEQFFTSVLSILWVALAEMKNCSRITKYLVPTYC